MSINLLIIGLRLNVREIGHCYDLGKVSSFIYPVLKQTNFSTLTNVLNELDCTVA